MFNQVNAAPKPDHKRRAPKRKEQGRIKPQTYAKVFERDNGQCILCARGDSLQCHHHVYRSQLGKGTEDNLVMLCVSCHELAHSSKVVRERIGEYLKGLYPKRRSIRRSHGSG
ncbi:HNH endonuclease [Brevibacillus sp. M2.1A]|uniref:HNH endonuclease n=1 Tax=Brevibacillus sp. M2.1A TaxID=2738980 RepID=UPI00156B011E